MDNDCQHNDSFTGEWANLWGLDQLTFENELLLPTGTQPQSTDGYDGTSITAEVAEAPVVNEAAAGDVRR
jgi:hypothetical protein